MGFKKGGEKPVGSGRKKGVDTKMIGQLRNMLREGLVERVPRFFAELDQLDGDEYTRNWLGAMKTVVPTLKSQEEEDAGKTVSSAYQLIIKMANKE